ncbi:MAG: hypothetical protein KAS13_06680, partial [Candidatus Omnitrophica bacterium]|nr:hypothetical protein [Candidatus Omnitrophota bacterium]
MIYGIMRKNLNLPVFAIIIGMVTSNISFALEDDSKTGTREMLAPVMCVDAGLFQQGYEQAIDLASQNSVPLDPVQVVEKLIADSGSLKNDHLISDFIAAFKEAFDLYKKGYEAAAFFEGSLTVVNHLPKIYQNKDGAYSKATAVNMFNESARVFETIDINQLKQLFTAEEIEVVCLVLTLKAEVFYQLAENDSSLSPRQKLNNYSKVKTFLLDAFSLQNIEPDFQSILIMGTACAQLATDSKLSLEEKLIFSGEALDYFKLAKEKSAVLEQTSASKKMIDEMYYTYFTVLHFAGNECKKNGDYPQAILFYDKVIPLADNLLSQPDALPRLRRFYWEYYHMLWAFSDSFHGKIPDDFEERKAGIFTSYTKTMALAGKYIELLSKAAAAADEGLDPLICITEVSAKLSGESIKDNDWAAASEHLGQAVRALKDMHKIQTHDQYSNFFIAKMNILFMRSMLEFIKAYVTVNGTDKSQIKKLTEMFDREFFAEFLADLENGKYQGVLETLSKTDGQDAKALLTRNLFCGSASNAKVRKYLNQVLLVKQKDKVLRAKFNNSCGYSTRIMLAAAYLHEASYAKAKQNIVEASEYAERFHSSSFIVETILAQAALDGQKGKDFIIGLFCSRAGTKIKNNIIEYKDSLSPKGLSMLKDIFTDKANKRLAKNS